MNAQKKEPIFFSTDLKNIMELITLKKNVMPVGSFSYKVHKYPSDIDMFEKIEYCCHLQEIKRRLVEKFKEIVKKASEYDEVFLSDFKAGYDKRFFIYRNYRKDDILGIIESSKLLYKNEKDDMKKLLKSKNYKEYSEYVRLLYTIRWSTKEILNGEKKLRGGEIKKLSDALSDKSVVKMDFIGKVDGDFKEITNYFYISWRDTNGTARHLTKPLASRIKSLDSDIKKYKNKDSLKYAKRVWLKYMMLNNKGIVNKLNPLFSSDAALMYQVSSEARALITLLKLKNNVKIKNDILEQIDRFKSRLSYVNMDISRVHKYFDNIAKDDSKIINNLENIIEILDTNIEEFSKDFLKNLNLRVDTRNVSDKKYIKSVASL